jgi:hypothetical protein
MNMGAGAISAPLGDTNMRQGPPVSISRSHSVHQPSGLTPKTFFKRTVSLKSLHSTRIRWDLYNHHTPKPRRGAKGLGVRFEKRALQIPSPHASEALQCRLISGPILEFTQGSKPQRAIPDALLFSADWNSICVIECKLRHTADAFYQLQAFYLPILSRIFPSFRVCTLELCKFYDPGVRLPRSVAFVNTFDEAFTIRECFHPVLIVS